MKHSMIQEQDKKMNDGYCSLEYSEGQQVFLSCNKMSSCCPSLSSSRLEPQTLRVLEELGGVLRGIHDRMRREGYNIIDGILTKVDE